MTDRMRVTPPFRAAPAATRVSVVIPCYNYGRYLPAAVASALSQRGVEVDVTIVDDASTDDSLQVARDLAAGDARVRVVAHPENRGHVETYNEALGLATGEYIVKLDADDLLTSGSLARSAALMNAYPDVAFCYGRPVEFPGDDVPTVAPAQVREWIVWRGDAWLERIFRRGHNVILQPEVFLRRSAVEATGGYRVQLRWAEDYNWWLRLAATGRVGRVQGPVQGLYRVHGKSLQRSVDDIELADLRARTDATVLFFDEQPKTAKIDRMRRIAFRSLTRNARELAAAAKDRATGGVEASRAFAEIARELTERAGGSVGWHPTAATGLLGRVSRDLQWRLRWRRWNATGV